MYDRLIVDSDFVIFEAASLGEERTIRVVHEASGTELFANTLVKCGGALTKRGDRFACIENDKGEEEAPVQFKSRTAFYGHYLKKNGGWLKDLNRQRAGDFLPFPVEDFIIEDVQTPKPFGHVVNVINTRMNSIMEKLGCTNVSHYVSGGDSWRIDASTLIKYKGNRDGGIRPIHLKEAQEYVVNKLGGVYVTDTVDGYEGVLEVDDRVVMEWWKDKKAGLNSVVVQIDKDGCGTGVLLFNPDKMDIPLDTSGLGKLWIDDKKKVRGWGRKWLYQQILDSDMSDNYSANSASSMKWGEKAAFQLLDSCKTDSECWKAMIDGYKQLYPDNIDFVGWRGNAIKIGWMYVLEENWKLARMLRSPEDFIEIKDVLHKLEVL